MIMTTALIKSYEKKLARIQNYFHTIFLADSHTVTSSVFCVSGHVMTNEGCGHDHMVGSWIYNYLYNQCLSPLKL
jgi:hypothetical protein